MTHVYIESNGLFRCYVSTALMHGCFDQDGRRKSPSPLPKVAFLAWSLRLKPVSNASMLAPWLAPVQEEPQEQTTRGGTSPVLNMSNDSVEPLTIIQIPDRNTLLKPSDVSTLTTETGHMLFSGCLPCIFLNLVLKSGYLVIWSWIKGQSELISYISQLLRKLHPWFIFHMIADEPCDDSTGAWWLQSANEGDSLHLCLTAAAETRPHAPFSLSL